MEISSKPDKELVIQSLCCGRNSTGNSLVVSLVDNSAFETTKVYDRIIINPGDSCLKFCLEYGIKLVKVSTIVITSMVSRNFSGLPSLILSLSDLGLGKVVIIGPPGIEGIIENMTPFVNRKYPEIEIIKISLNSSNIFYFTESLTLQFIPNKLKVYILHFFNLNYYFN